MSKLPDTIFKAVVEERERCRVRLAALDALLSEGVSPPPAQRKPRRITVKRALYNGLKRVQLQNDIMALYDEGDILSTDSVVRALVHEKRVDVLAGMTRRAAEARVRGAVWRMATRKVLLERVGKGMYRARQRALPLK